jgi:signal transduction histidine kinase
MNKIFSRRGTGGIRDWLKTYSQGPRLLQLLVFGIIFMLLTIIVINYPVYISGWRFFGIVITLTALLALNILWTNPNPAASPRRQVSYDWAFLIISNGLVLAATWMSGEAYMAYLIAIVCVQAGFRKGIWPVGLAFGAANLLILLAAQIAQKSSFWAIVSAEIPLAASILFGLAVATLVERYARQTQRAEALLRELQAANAELESARQKEKDLAIAEERVRLARDIHDGLGHHLTVLSIQLQAAGKLVERNPQAAAEAIQACRSETQAALEEVRHSVGVLRQAPAQSQPLTETLAALVQSFDQHAGTQVCFETSGVPVELSPFAREAFFRTVQEGLTNVQKHAGDARCVWVRLAYEPQAVRLSLRDDGQAAADARTHPAGFGLAGLGERAAQLGGNFRSGPYPGGGFEIEMEIPIPGRAP